ncbi:hypothetical protein ACG9ZL_03270 [Acinetobacter sp. ULE_I057]|uniref:hypothetical protein n=1 Tax=Acinetobacter sp. ULE_I057 TaxID=3373070 RepID=UPI003AF68B87
MAIKIRHTLMVLLAVMLVPACLLMFLPAQPEMNWQHNVFQFITEKLKVQTGMFGPLGFYTVSITAYFSLLSSIWAVFLFCMIWQEERETAPQTTTQTVQFKLLDGVIMVVCVIGFIWFSFSMMQWHFAKQDMTIGLGRNGYLFQSLYHYQLGVVFAELFFMLFLVFSQLAILMLVYASYHFLKEKFKRIE